MIALPKHSLKICNLFISRSRPSTMVETLSEEQVAEFKYTFELFD
jgi:hypothetical protein